MSTTADVASTAASARSARWVAAGIFLSRITGFIRERAVAHYFGNSLYADVFRGALRMPNVLQNLLGEGALSASFIPVYAELLERGRKDEAGRVAGAIFALLVALAGAMSLMGLLLAPVLVDIFLAGFEDERRALAIVATRIVFPMAGVLVLSAWALGVLNSHRRFFVSYVAPVGWNGAMIAALLIFGGRLTDGPLLIALVWGAFFGGLIQFLVQLPWVLRLERELHVRWDTRLTGVRTAVRNAVPAILGRGVVQVSSWFDLFLASFLATGALSAMGYAQMFYMLPVSLFGMSVAAAELPELSRNPNATADVLRNRLRLGMRRIAALVVPSIVGYVLLGDVVVAGVLETGEFGVGDTRLVHFVLLGYTLGLLATTGTRLYSSAFFALRDTRTPARIAAVRVLLAGALGASLMLPLDRVAISPELRLGALGLSLATGVAAWVEWALLRRSLARRIGVVSAGAGFIVRLFAIALVPALLARTLFLELPPLHPLLTAAVVLTPFGAGYFLLAHLFGIEEADAVVGRFVRRRSV